MVSDFGITKYCRKCGLEIVREGDCVTMTADSKFCECDKPKKTIQEIIIEGKMKRLKSITNKNYVSGFKQGYNKAFDEVEKMIEEIYYKDFSGKIGITALDYKLKLREK